MNLNDLRDLATKTATANGFTEATVGEEVALMHSELSELLEEHRLGHGPNEIWFEDRASGTAWTSMYPKKETPDDPKAPEGPLKPCGIPSEIADVIIRALHFCGKHGIDVTEAVRSKMKYNEARSFRHGGKLL